MVYDDQRCTMRRVKRYSYINKMTYGYRISDDQNDEHMYTNKVRA